MFENDFDDVDAVEIPGLPQERFRVLIVQGRVDDEVEVFKIPSGKSACGFANICLAVIAYPHGKEFHYLAGKVFVGGTFHIHPGIEVIEHARVLGDGDGEVAEVPGGVALEHVDLQQHFPVIPDFVLSGGEMPVPEERHLLFERPRGVEHALGPPVTHPTGL